MRTFLAVLLIGAVAIATVNAAYIHAKTCTYGDVTYTDGEVVPVSTNECWVCRCSGGTLTVCSNELCPEQGVGK